VCHITATSIFVCFDLGVKLLAYEVWTLSVHAVLTACQPRRDTWPGRGPSLPLVPYSRGDAAFTSVDANVSLSCVPIVLMRFVLQLQDFAADVLLRDS